MCRTMVTLNVFIHQQQQQPRGDIIVRLLLADTTSERNVRQDIRALKKTCLETNLIYHMELKKELEAIQR